MRAWPLAGVVVALTVASRAEAQPIAVAPEAVQVKRIEIGPVTGTVSGALESSLPKMLRTQAAQSGFQIVASGGDAVLETMIVADDDGCTVRSTLKVRASGNVTDAAVGCRPARTRDEQIATAVREATSGVLVLARTQPAPIAKGAPGPPPPLPPPPPASPTAAGNGWVFEASPVNLRTAKFAGLGHMAVGTDETDRFRGVFALTIVHAQIDDFSGVLDFAFGKNESKTFRGGLAVGLLTNQVDDFSGVAEFGLRKNETKRFAGVAQIAVGESQADHFAGVLQFAALSKADDAAVVVQSGFVCVTKQFAGVAQACAVNAAAHDFAGIVQIGIGNASFDGTLRAGAQIGVLNFVEREAQAGAQIGAANLFGRYRGPAQIGVFNLDGSKRPEDFIFGSFTGNGGADFEGGVQVGVWNATYHSFEGAVQAGGLNVTRASFRGGAQVGLLFDYVRGDFEGAFELGPGNMVLGKFMGFAQIGGGNLVGSLMGSQIGLTNNALEEMRGAQIGVINVAHDARGLQLGVFNRARKLTGLQLGVVNWIADRDTLPVLPVANAGF
jgi:hypothetical protein